MFDNATEVEKFSSTPSVVSGESDSGIENGMLHDNPVLNMVDQEENVARGSGDVHEVYAVKVFVALEKSAELGNSDRANWVEDRENRKMVNIPTEQGGDEEEANRAVASMLVPLERSQSDADLNREDCGGNAVKGADGASACGVEGDLDSSRGRVLWTKGASSEARSWMLRGPPRSRLERGRALLESQLHRMEPLSIGCETDLLVIGMQPGEEVATILRYVALIFSASITFAWHDRKCRRHMRLFCLHWASGLVYTSSQLLLSLMILLCWSTSRVAHAIRFVKFLEVSSLNVWSLSSVALAVLIANIVQAFDRCQRVPAVIGSPNVLWGIVIFSIVLTGCASVSWQSFAISGSYIWLYHKTSVDHNIWIGVAYILTQMLAAVVMSCILIYLLTQPRRASLGVCCKTSDRIYYYLMLTIFGTFVYVLNALCVLLFEAMGGLRNGNAGILFKIAWCLKYVHVIADTLILVNALKSYHRHTKDARGSSGSSSRSSSKNECLRCTSSGRIGHVRHNRSLTPSGFPEVKDDTHNPPIMAVDSTSTACSTQNESPGMKCAAPFLHEPRGSSIREARQDRPPLGGRSRDVHD